jgi:CheY-like chemotaxis protein
MKILLIEDDNLYSDELTADLKEDQVISEGGLTVDLVSTERDFRDRFDTLAKANYDFVIIDVMVAWERARPDRRKPDPDVLEGGIYRAGFRCVDMLRRDRRTQDIPIVVHTNFQEGRPALELREKYESPLTKFVPKSGDKEPLLASIREWSLARAQAKS